MSTQYFIKWMWDYWGNGTNKIIRQNPINGNHSKHDGQHCMHARIVGGRITAGRRKRCLSTCMLCIGRAIPATSKSLQVMMMLMLGAAALPLPLLCHWGGSLVWLFLAPCCLSFVCTGQRRQGEIQGGIKSKNIMTLHLVPFFMHLFLQMHQSGKHIMGAKRDASKGLYKCCSAGYGRKSKMELS